MSTFNVPTRNEVNTTNQGIFDHLEKAIGFVPNVYAAFAHSEHALKNYLDFSNAKISLNAKQKEVINLAVSQVNGCEYCLSAHTAIAGMNGYTADQILELRKGTASFDAKLDTLAKFAKNSAENRGNVDSAVLENFLSSGWTKENLIDTIVAIGETTITNYVNNTTKVPVDFPAIAALS